MVSESPHPDSPKLRLLRPFSVVISALTYCAGRAGPLFVIVWYACFLRSASQLALEWLVLAYPPTMPDALLSQQFYPPTWLTALVIAPWEAMAWLFVLSDMSTGDRNRGSVTLLSEPLRWLRFELNQAVLVAAAIFSAVNLFDGLSRWAQLQLLVVATSFIQFSNDELEVWANLSVAARFVALALVTAWSYPIAGQVLRTGKLDVAAAWQIMRGNRLRLFIIFLLLMVILTALDRLLGPAIRGFARFAANDPLSWTFREAFIGYVLDFPLSILWIVANAVTVGIVLDTLERRAPRPDPERTNAQP